MRLVIGYDGSEGADAALDGLRFAGLPLNSEAHVISVAEVWLPGSPLECVEIVPAPRQVAGRRLPIPPHPLQAHAVASVRRMANAAAQRLSELFPLWNIRSEGVHGSAAWELLSKAFKLHADLIVVGSQGRSALGRLMIGSVSQKVVTEAECPVRVARAGSDKDRTPARIIVGYDGSPGANAAVDAVASRDWPANSEVILAVVKDGGYKPLTIPGVDVTQARDLELTREAVGTLQSAGLFAKTVALCGNPKQLIVDIAKERRADCIFVGANRFGTRLERFLLGSVSAAVANRAHCSVEVVRRN